jgi:hypothetical protein
LRLEIAQAQHELDDLGGDAPAPEEVADFLRGFTAGLRDLSLPEQQARIRSVIGRLTYNQIPASDGVEHGSQASDGGHSRTRGFLAMARMSSRPAESADSAGLRDAPHNQTASGSGIGGIGSAG